MELLSFILELLLFIYLLHIVNNHQVKLPLSLIMFFVCILTSNILTVIEDYCCFRIFNLMEHSLFTLACAFLFIYIYTLKAPVAP